MYCRYCGTDNPSSMDVCLSCGKPLAGAQTQVQFKKKRYARGRHHAAVGHGGPEPGRDEPIGAPLKPAASKAAPPSPPESAAREADGQSAAAATATAAQPRPGMQRTRYLFPKTPWHSPLPDPAAARPAATPPSFAPILSDDEMERRIVLHHRKRRSWAARLARTVLYGVSVMLVLVAGLIATVWVEEHGGVGPTVAMLVSKSVGAPDQNDNPRAQPSRHELPYDGQSPEDAGHIAARAAMPVDPATVQDEAPAAGAATAAAPEAERATTPAASVVKNAPAAAKRAGAPAATVATAAGERDGTASSGAGADGKGDSERSKAKAEEAADAKADAAKAASANKTAQLAKPASKPKASPQRVARGKEITRIQRQAAEELKKKTRSRAGSALAATKPAPATRRPALQRISYVQSLARCDRAGNFFRREQCKWKVCDGNWGKGGCPSAMVARFTAD